MKSRIARLGVVLLPVLALFASMAPPASALGAGAVAFVGTAVVGNGIAYPCLDGKVTPPSVNVDKCLGPLATTPNSAGVTFSTTAAAGALASATKGKCPGTADVCLEAGTFSVAASGTVVGACGFSTGALAGAVTPVVSVSKTKTRNFTVSFVGAGGALILTGTTSKGEILVGAALAVPTTGSCLNKSPKAFTVVGVVAVANT